MDTLEMLHANEVGRILDSLDLAVLIIDTDQHLISFSQNASQMLGLTGAQIGSRLSETVSLFDLSKLDEWLAKTCDTGKPWESAVEGANETWYSLRITPYQPATGIGCYAILAIRDITESRHVEQRLRDELERNEAIVNTVSEPLIVLNDHLQIQTANDTFYKAFHVDPAETEKRYLYDLGNGQWDIPELRRLLEDILPSYSEFRDYEVEHDFPSIGPRIMRLNAREFQRNFNHTRLILLAIEDITERKSAEQALNETLERLHHISEVLQRALIADLTIDRGNVEIAAIYQPALAEAEVGGDFYDVFPLDENRLAIVFGDVSGKGLNAAVFTAMSKYMLRAYAYEHKHPHRVMERFNEAMTQYMPADMFVTVQYGILDISSMTFTYTNGGHEPPLLYDYECVCSTPQDLPGSLIGILPGRKFGEATIHLDPGNAMVFYTDGITDARKNGQFYGITGLSNTLEAIGNRDAQTIASAVLEAAVNAADGVLRDDAAVLVVKVK